MDTNDKISEILSRGVAEVIDSKHLAEKLRGKKKLRIKLGIDPTSPNIHIGRAINLWKMRAFQDLGHTAVFIVGDFTGIIGDSSDKDSERPMLTLEQVKENGKTYFEQAFKILDKKKTEVHHNSEWLSKLNVLELSRIASQFGLHEFAARENIARRMKADKRVSYLELMYPLFQGYDSVAVKADVELGGTDQRFNLLTGRDVQKDYKQEPQDIMMTEILEGTDGRKMSSSWGNVINITDEPNDMFGKVMSIKDELMPKYFVLATRVPLSEIKNMEDQAKSDPRNTKIRLATELVTLYHGKKAAKAAADEFEKVFSNKELPTDMPEVKVKASNIVEVMMETGLVESKSEAKRLIEQGGVSLDGKKVTDETLRIQPITKDTVLQVGKRKFVKLVR
ncbi:MAG TPA: tyrosine--tRNA ligase [Patescibacteria group bacterium]|nr:tyrosine--tRNA ligase [Patescibacteria group bacterium]